MSLRNQVCLNLNDKNATFDKLFDRRIRSDAWGSEIKYASVNIDGLFDAHMRYIFSLIKH